MIEKLTRYWEENVEKGFSTFLTSLLLPISLFYRFVNTIHSYIFTSKFFTVSHEKATIISVGNITVGGSGKTPWTLFFLEELEKNCSIPQERVALVSRGYRSSKREEKTALVKDKSTFKEGLGDESLLLKRRSRASIICCKKKWKGVQFGIECGIDFFILDDAFQHYRLKRDIDIVLLETKSFDQSHSIFPLGRYREGLKALQRADLLVANDLFLEKEWLEACKKLKCYTNAPLVSAKPCIERFCDFGGVEIQLSKCDIAILTAIARPYRVQKTLQDAGLCTVASKTKSDHAPFLLDEIKKFVKVARAKGAQCLLTTEKDWVKLKELPLELELPIYYVEIGLNIQYGEKVWRTFLKEVKDLYLSKKSEKRG